MIAHRFWVFDFDMDSMNDNFSNLRAPNLKQILGFLPELPNIFFVVMFLGIAIIHRQFIGDPEIYRSRVFLSLLVFSEILAIVALTIQWTWIFAQLFRQRNFRFWLASGVGFVLLLLVLAAFWVDSPTLLFAT